MMDPAMDEGAPLPSKRPRTNCLIHCSNDDSDSLVTLNDLDSWKTARDKTTFHCPRASK